MKIQQMFPAVDPNKLLANSSNPDRVFSSEVFMGVYDKDRDQVYNLYFASTAPVSQRLQPLSTYVTGNLGLFNHVLLGSETSDYRFQSQWEMASGLGATGYSFIKFKPIDRPDPLDENSEYYYAKMIPLITMQEMYYIMVESSSTDMDKYSWYNKARIRRGLPDLDAMGMGPTFAMYWGYGYGGYGYGSRSKKTTYYGKLYGKIYGRLTNQNEKDSRSYYYYHHDEDDEEQQQNNEAQNDAQDNTPKA